MANCLRKCFVIVIARDRQDRPLAIKKCPKGHLKVIDRLPQTIRASQITEEIASDDQDINPLRFAEHSDTFHGEPQVVRAVDPTQSIIQMPIGRMQNSHSVIVRNPSIRGNKSLKISDLQLFQLF
jgi:hypothetical protein